MVCLSQHSWTHSSRPALSGHKSRSSIISLQRHAFPSAGHKLRSVSCNSGSSSTKLFTSPRHYILCCSRSPNSSGSPSDELADMQQPNTFESRAAAFCGRITSLFPLWVIIAAGLALTFPPLFLPIAPHLTTGLALTMLGMVCGLFSRVEASNINCNTL